LAQTIADLLKLIHKEDIIPARADRGLFKMAPFVIFVAVFAGFSLLPVAPGWHGSNAPTGIFALLAIISLDVIGIIMAGWSSNNKYSVLGSFRAAAQIISYEVPLGLSVLCVCMVCQSLNLQTIATQQGIFAESSVYFFGILNVTEIGGFLSWNVFQAPILFIAWIIFFIASLAESNRAPFDLPEAESELVAGFHTEYTGFRWAIIMLGEYAMMLLVSIIGVVLFFGGWNTPLPNIGQLQLATWTQGQPGELSGFALGAFWLMLKSILLVAVQIWIRWTYPRLRVDQLMKVSWKYLTPISFALVVLSGFWRLIFFV
jgi:NADH-quinone oxidoreductase subunit H